MPAKVEASPTTAAMIANGRKNAVAALPACKHHQHSFFPPTVRTLATTLRRSRTTNKQTNNRINHY